MRILIIGLMMATVGAAQAIAESNMINNIIIRGNHDYECNKPPKKEADFSLDILPDLFYAGDSLAIDSNFHFLEGSAPSSFTIFEGPAIYNKDFEKPSTYFRARFPIRPTYLGGGMMLVKEKYKPQ